MPDHAASKPTLSFAKLVTTPSDAAWSQAYNAGNLFVCLALTMDEPEEGVLQTAGKEVFNLMQSEFFALEDKSPQAVKEAIKVSTAKLSENITLSITLANFKDNALTVFIAGSGKVVMKRGERVGTLLEKHNTGGDEIVYASGFLENADTIVLQTGQFAEGISQETVVGALDLELPNDVIESLTPQVNEQDNGAQSAIVVRYNGPAAQKAAAPESEEIDETNTNEPLEEPTIASVAAEQQMSEREETSEEKLEGKPTEKKPLFTLPTLPSFGRSHLNLSHKRKLYLSIAIILFVLLGASIFFTIKKDADEQRKAIFKEVYASAKKDYETGQGIESLNPEGSRENYLRAETTLKEGQTKIAKGTEEYKQLEDLLAQVTQELQGNEETETNTLKEATAPESSLTALAKDNASAKGFGQNTDTVYMITSDAITAITKSSGNKKEVVENDNAWDTPQAVVPYQTNLYVLDQKNGVLKFVPSGDTYSKSSYFTGTAPDLSKATGMAIDSSIWIVTTDGKVLKYTRGAQDTFGLSGVNKPLQNPTKIITDGTMDSVYVMDNGNKRIVQFDKKGAFIKEYPAGIIGAAKEFEVDQKNNRFLILSGNKIWELPL